MAGTALNSSTSGQGGSPSASEGFGTPIALLNFNRPQMTRRVFDVVRKIKPRRLLLVADGPRESRPDDTRLCAEVRAIFDEIDWECEVFRNFSATNLGSFKRNSSGLNWVFDTVEEAIILEDDCIPSLTFFPYCEELLERYRNDPRVGVIGGNNFGFPEVGHENDSYFFSAYPTIWGWASWRRVWQEVDLSMSWWEPKAGKKKLQTLFPWPADWKYYHQIYENIHSGKRKNAWDYQLLLSCFRHSQCGVIPRVNLVSNIGFGADATNCTEPTPWQDFPRGELAFPLVHPANVLRSVTVDHAIFCILNIQQTLGQRAINKLARIFKRIRKKISGEP
jgi:hypothetical protein